MTVSELDLIEDLRHRARRLHDRARGGDDVALRWIAQQQGVSVDDKLQRRHCLTALAKALGFAGWPHAKDVLGGQRPTDMGELAYVETGGAIWNVWSASYAEASRIRAEHGGYLLPYRRHFQIVEAPYIEALGCDPQDNEWDLIGRDWVRPLDRSAWCRLTQAMIRSRLNGTSSVS
jgi:hypothetical protein